jgi:predicted nucleotidyltransferase
VTTKLQGALDEAVSALRTELGDNLYSCCVYGSAVRGNSIEGVSDINLLIIINESSSAAHEAIARAIGRRPLIDPFVLARRGFERSVRAFATKFASIKRHHRVLHGADPLADVTIDAGLEKFLCEQALRNIRLRLIYSYVTRQQHKAYEKFVLHNITGLFVQLSEVLRLQGTALPMDFEARIRIMEKAFKIDGRTLYDLLALKKNPHKFSESDTVNWHERLFPLADAVLGWIETNWLAK